MDHLPCSTGPPMCACVFVFVCVCVCVCVALCAHSLEVEARKLSGQSGAGGCLGRRVDNSAQVERVEKHHCEARLDIVDLHKVFGSNPC